MFDTVRTSNLLIRLSVVVLVGTAMSACSSVPDWVDPTTWAGDSPASEPSTAPDNQSAADETAGEGKTVAEASDKYPTLADTPDKAPPASSTDEQKQVANALVADRAQAQYSADALRAATVEAPPPPPPGPADESAGTPSEKASSGDQASDDDSSTDAAQTADSTETQTAPSPASEKLTGRAPMPGTLPVLQPSSPAAPATQVAALTPPPAAPAAPAVATATAPAPTYSAPAAASAPAASDNLGFQPSHAPPLDPSVSRFVSSSVINRYERTASLAAAPGIAPGSASRGRVAPASYSPMGSGAPAAIVAFPNGATTLDAAARAQVQAAVAAFRTQGSQGYVRVVGHASGAESASGTQQSLTAFDRSQARANAVAQELIKQGVPAKKVLVEADGDTRTGSQPDAEVFLQS